MKTFVNFLWALILFGSLFLSCQQPSLEPTPTQTELKANVNARVAALNSGWGIPWDCSDMAIHQATGNVYVVGQIYGYRPPLTIDNVVLTVSNTSINSIFIIKFSSRGRAQWGHVIQGNFASVVEPTIQVDAQDNAYITANFVKTISIAGNNLTASVGGSVLFNMDSFVTKFNSTGGVQFTRQFGGNGLTSIRATTLDLASGALFVAGNLSKTAVSGNVATFGALSLLCNTDNDIFIVPVGGTGNIGTVRRFGTTTSDETINDITFGQSISGNSLYITGRFTTPTSLSGVPLSTSGLYNTFAAELVPNSSVVWWATPITQSTTGGVTPNLSITSRQGVCLVGGWYNSLHQTVQFSAPTPQGADAFVCALGPSGAVNWKQWISTPGDDEVADLDAEINTSNFWMSVNTTPILGQKTMVLRRLSISGGILDDHSFTSSSGQISASRVRFNPMTLPNCRVLGTFTGTANLGTSVSQVGSLYNSFVLKAE
jgi:hypothetical protein